MPGKAQLDSMVEEVQSSVSHITQFLPENAYGFLEAQKSNESLQAMKRYYKLSELSNELFIKLREVMIPLKEEQMRTALYAISAFATGGCLKVYYEDHLKDDRCSWEMDNAPIVDVQEVHQDDHHAGTHHDHDKKETHHDQHHHNGEAQVNKQAASALEQNQETILSEAIKSTVPIGEGMAPTDADTAPTIEDKLERQD